MMKAFHDPIPTCMFMSSSVHLQLCLTKACKMTDQAKWPCHHVHAVSTLRTMKQAQATS